MAGVREVGTVERAERTYGGTAVGEEKEEGVCSLQNEINRSSEGVELSRMSLSANTVFRSAMTAS